MSKDEKELRRMTPPAYSPIRMLTKRKAKLRLSHTVQVDGHGTAENLSEAYTAWRLR